MPPGYKLPGSFGDLFFCFSVLNFYNDFPECGSFLYHLAFGRTLHFEFVLQLGWNFLFFFSDPLYLFSRLRTPLVGCWNFWIHLYVFYLFHFFFFLFRVPENKRGGTFLSFYWSFYFSGHLIFNLLQCSVTSYVNETKGPVTALALFPNCSCSAFST